MSALTTTTATFITEAFNARQEDCKPFENLNAIKTIINEIKTNPEQIISALERLQEVAAQDCLDSYVCPNCGGEMMFKYSEDREIYYECNRCKQKI